MPWIEEPKSPLVAKLRGVHLFHFEGAPCAQRVRFALGEKGLRRGREVRWNSDAADACNAEPGTWTSRHVSLIRRQHLTDEYAAIHPHMVVPALVHDGRLCIESMDIVRYLDEAWPENPLTPHDPGAAELAASLVEEGKRLHVSVRYVSFRWGLGRLGRLSAKEEKTVGRLEPAGSPERLAEFYGGYDRNTIEESTYLAHLAALEQGYAQVESLLADGRPFLTGDAFSMADIIWSLKVLRIHECGYPFQQRFPVLFDWFTRVSARPGFRDGVMSRHRALHRVFRAKATVEGWLGRGLRNLGRDTAADAG